MIEQNKEMFDLGVQLIEFSFFEANADMGEIYDVNEGKEQLIKQFNKIMEVR